MSQPVRRTFFEWVVVVSPTLLVLAYAFLLLWPQTRRAVELSLRENQAVELITFATLFLAVLMALGFAWRCRKRGSAWWVGGFFVLFAVGLFFAAMEEIAWGQWFLGYETPDYMKKINRQDEVTLHNIKGLHNKTEYLRLAFGLGGLLGIWVARIERFRPLAASPLLLSWFLWIAVLAGFDLHNDFYDIEKRFDRMIHQISEVVEMMVGIAAVLYMAFRMRER